MSAQYLTGSDGIRLDPIGSGVIKMKQKNRDVFKGVDFSALGQAIVDEAKRINHQRHLNGELDPSWSECLQQAQKIVIPKFIGNEDKEKGGSTNGSAG